MTRDLADVPFGGCKKRPPHRRRGAQASGLRHHAPNLNAANRSVTATTTGPRLGIALGGGGARGWAHIGVLAALAEAGIEPEIICGTSIGALVGGIHAAGKLDELERWVVALRRREVLTLVDPTVGGGGILGGRRLMELYRRHLGDVAIEELPRRFAAVATDLDTGAEVWLQEGSLLDAIRASISIPGVFTPVQRDGRWLVDGGLVNPVPVNLCRAMGADLVIAVDLHAAELVEPEGLADPEGVAGRRAGLRSRLSGAAAGERPPGVAWVLQSALDIMQTRIGRSRLVGDPPDVLLSPRVLQVQPLEFAGGAWTIEEGRSVVRRMLPTLQDLLTRDGEVRL